MESKRKLPLSFNSNIPRTLFPKTYSFNENKNYTSKDKQKKSEEFRQNSKLFKSLKFYRKVPINENKNDQNIIQNSEIRIDSRTEARLPQGYIDLSFDNPKNE